MSDRQMCLKCLVNGHSVWWIGASQSAEYQETAKEGQSSVFWLFAEADIYFDTQTLMLCLVEKN
jgi:hypothetical protein